MSKQEVILARMKLLWTCRRNCPHDRLFILTDDHTHRLCLSQLMNLPFLKDAVEITIGAEDVHKTLETLASVWQVLVKRCYRHSLLSISEVEW